jgi:hypothetical protein
MHIYQIEDKIKMDNKIKRYNIKIFLNQLIILLFTFLFTIPSPHAETKIVKVGVYENPPKVFTLESGEPAGIFIDIIEHVAASEDWRLEYVFGTWTEGLDRLAEGKIDLMPDVADTASRALVYSFHQEPILSSWFQVYTGKGAGVRSLLDLAGKRIAVLDRSVQQEAFTELAAGFELDATLISLPDYRTIFEIVAKGEADAAITNRFYGLMHAQKYGLEDTKVVFHPTRLFFAAPKSGPQQLLDTLDTYILNLKNDSESVYYQSLKRWISEEAPFKIPLWAQVVAWIAGVILLMSLAGSVFLKRQVNARTRELTQINQEMESRIVQRTAEITEAYEKLEEAYQKIQEDREKIIQLERYAIVSRITSTLAHETRNSVSMIGGFAALLKRKFHGDPDLCHHIDTLLEESKKLEQLIEGILKAAHKTESQFKKVNPNKLMDELKALTQEKARLSNVQIRDEKQPSSESIFVDKESVIAALKEIVMNAVEASPKDGEVIIKINQEDEWVVISVADKGQGMDEKTLSRIYEPLFSTKKLSAGLGLSFAKELIEAQNGYIRYESILGEGSTFKVYFPVISARRKK